MADRGFRQVGHCGDEARQVPQIEVVAGIDDEPQRAGARRGFGAGAQLGCAVTGAERGGVGPGIDFDAVGAGIAQPRDDRRVGIDEQDDAAAERLQRGDGVLDDRVVAAVELPALLRGEGAGRVGHQRALLRADLAHDLEQPLVRISLDVQLAARPPRPHQLGQRRHVGCGGCGARRDADARSARLPRHRGRCGRSAAHRAPRCAASCAAARPC